MCSTFSMCRSAALVEVRTMAGVQVTSSPAKSYTIKDRIAQIYYKHGLYCSSHPLTLISFACVTFLLACYPLLHIPLLGSSSQQFATPISLYSAELDADSQKIGPRWFQGPPVAYVQQVVVRSAVSPWQSDMILMDAFRSPIAESFRIMELIGNHKLTDSSGRVRTMQDVCLQVGETKDREAATALPQYGCLVVSPTYVWKQDYNSFLQDGKILASIFNQKGDTSESYYLREILFGVPWKETGVKKFCVRNRQRVITYAVTMILKEWDPSTMYSLEDKLLETYHQGDNSSAKQRDQKEIVHVHFQYQHTLAEFVPLAAVYIILFFYIYFSVRKIELVKSKWAISICAVLTVMMSLFMSVGLCLWFGLNPTLNGSPLVSPRSSCMPSEILPYLVVVIGLENMLVLTKSVVSTPGHVGAKVRLAQGLGKEGWSITKNLLTELVLLTFAFFTFVPAIQEFCMFAVVGLLSDFFLQMVFFATVLSIDIQRKEKSDLKKGKSEAVWSGEDNTRNAAGAAYRTRRGDGVPVMSCHPTRATARVFATPTSPILKLPKRLRLVYFWARMRLIQRGLMVCLVIWIIVLIHRMGIVERLTDNTTGITPKLAESVHPILQMFTGQNRSEETEDATKEQHLENANLQHSKLKLWEALPTKHWTTLFGYYNISLSGRYISILPPVLLSVPIPATKAIQMRHVDDHRIVFHANWRIIPNIDAEPENSPGGLIHPASQAEVTLVFALSVPSIVFVVYLFVTLYRCMCSRNYAEWRTSWSALRPPKGGDEDTYLLMETYPIRLQGHNQEVDCVITEDSAILSSDLSGNIAIWDANTGECINTLKRRRNGRKERKLEGCDLRGSFSSDSTYGSSPTDSCDPGCSCAQSASQDQSNGPGRNQSHGYDFSKYVSEQWSPIATDADDRVYRQLSESNCEDLCKAVRGTASWKGKPSIPFQALWCMGCYGPWLVIGCEGGRLELWHTLTGDLCGTYTDNAEGVTTVTVSGHRVIVSRINGMLECWHLEITSERKPSERGAGDGSGSEVSAKLVWVNSVRAHTQPISVVCMGGGQVVTGSLDRLLKVFRCDTAMCVYTLHGHSGGISAIHVETPGASTAVSGCQEGVVCVWDLMTGTCAYSLTAHRGAVLALRTTSLYLLSLGSDSRLRIWEKTQGHLLHTLYQANSLCRNMELLSENIVITAKEDHLVLWDMNHGEAIQVIMLGPSDSGVSIHQLHRTAEAVLCDYGYELCVVYFPALSTKVD
ncbi:sterol regulatory element-binding protein cleavage-activating protein-like isoform X2 [Ornithodoros turicata]|uniref:sterol regulatory element-binding protein cleavage-activating protein-like isoform X2 n=1 Tax=Ornithodoros turicata TaxID=34597 RepID=UPI003139A1EF